MTEGEMDAALEKTLNELFPDHDDVPFDANSHGTARCLGRGEGGGGDTHPARRCAQNIPIPVISIKDARKRFISDL